MYMFLLNKLSKLQNAPLRRYHRDGVPFPFFSSLLFVSLLKEKKAQRDENDGHYRSTSGILLKKRKESIGDVFG